MSSPFGAVAGIVLIGFGLLAIMNNAFSVGSAWIVGGGCVVYLSFLPKRR
jgi:hypothetical protein